MNFAKPVLGKNQNPIIIYQPTLDHTDSKKFLRPKDHLISPDEPLNFIGSKEFIPNSRILKRSSRKPLPRQKVPLILPASVLEDSNDMHHSQHRSIESLSKTQINNLQEQMNFMNLYQDSTFDSKYDLISRQAKNDLVKIQSEDSI